jgi:integrin-linked kinase-associated serine/threonine phosphatase 2C
MPDIINTPETKNPPTALLEQGSDYFETQGKRPTMEDALAILHDFSEQERQAILQMNPIELGHRLWTAHRIINEDTLDKKFVDGSTASTTLFDGKANLITATLADASSFVAIYDTSQQLRAVYRLNSVTHTFKNPKEVQRVTGMGGTVFNHRFWGNLAVSRALGDHHMNDLVKKDCICGDSQIDVVNLPDLYRQLHIPESEVGTVKIISCCDGFTDGAGKYRQTKIGHEAFLKRCLKSKNSSLSLSEYLVQKALKHHSSDNVSVAVQTIVEDGVMREKPVVVAIYDGHCGALTASYAACNIGQIVRQLFLLSPKEYTQHPQSVYQQKASYLRDHPNEGRLLSDNVLEDVTTLEKPSLGTLGLFGKQQESCNLGCASVSENSTPIP